MTQFICKPAQNLSGTCRVPGDKSVSHRSIMLSSIAEGTSVVKGFLEGEDSLHTLKSFQSMGVDIQRSVDEIIIKGVGLYGLSEPTENLYMGNGGTGMRLLCGLMAGQSFPSVLTGDASLSGRPMGRITKPLTLMGASIATQEHGGAPLVISANSSGLHSIHYDMPMASAQVKSCLMLAGLYADGVTSITQPAITRDHTERMLQGFGVEVHIDANKISIQGGQKLTACNIDIPSDISSAAFFIVGATISKDTELTLKHVGVNPTRTGIIDILKLMGADITLSNNHLVGGEPVADILVKSAQLKGIDIPEHLVPLAIDEFPVLFVAASTAKGTTRLTGAKELRVKESDRIAVMETGLKAIGVDATATEDGMVINQSTITGGTVASHSDHRISMSFTMASLIAQNDIIINDCANVDTSFPGFVDLANKAGLNMSVGN